MTGINYGSKSIKEIYLGTPGGRLPSAYQEVEYIQSNGNGTNTGPHINPGLTLTSGVKFKVEIKFQWLNSTTDERAIYAQYYGSADRYQLGFISGGFQARLNSDTNGTLPATWTPNTYGYNNTYTVVSECTPSKTSSRPPFLFGQNEGDSYARWAISAKLYYFKAWENDVLKREMIPCYRKSDNVIGLYDLVNKTFYTNSGSGTFTKGADVNYTPIKAVYYGNKKVRPVSVPEVYYSDEAFAEYQSLVDSVGSVQFVDTGKRFRFNYGVYIGNRTALDFMYGSNVMRTINLDTLTSTSKTLSVTMPADRDLTIYYFGDNRILTPRGILDFNGNVITSFSYDGIVPGLPGVVRAHSGYDIYKGIVTGDNISFTKVGTSSADQFVGNIWYSRLGAYLMNSDDNQGSGYSAYVNPTTNVVTSFPANTGHSRTAHATSGPDGNLYRYLIRYAGWGRIQRVTTVSGDVLGTSLSTAWLAYGDRRGKFLGNIVSGGMNTSNGTGAGYGSASYFVNTSGDVTKVQDNAFAYDTGVQTCLGFIDENGWIYPRTYNGGSGVILKTDKTFTNLNWKNPYLWR